ncbi:glycoside hydrolase family 3 N-terminal domain-containing protein [Tardisphaera saccharovorans]
MGRTEETYGEDPYLVSSMGVAHVPSLQAQGVAATGKHSAGHGSSEGERNTCERLREVPEGKPLEDV